MEMSNDYIPELHVAQQRRRDKLRIQQLEDLHHSNNNFHHHHHSNNNNNNNNNSTTSMVFPSEMLNFTTPQSTTFASIHPSRFVAPSSSDSCDPPPLPNCDNWVSSNYYNHSNNVNVNGWETNVINELPLLPLIHHHNHGLSLSLSSNQIRDLHQLSHDEEPREYKPVLLDPGSVISSSVVKVDTGKSHQVVPQDVLGSSNNNVIYRNVGPLGPFTGYATILRGSKFLKPAQVMLDEFLTSAGLRHVRECEEVESVPSSIVLGSTNMSSGSGCGSGGESYRPDCNEKKAKLLHMQEEVCKRHKQYHQQMEMVMSAFESVPGLANATPYISRSLKAISRHFRTLKNAISDQLKLIKRALGEDTLSTPTSYNNNCGSRFDYNSNNYCVKAKTGGATTGYGGPQNHIWRPQRGLPERAVSVLRAWLFDHFLHPYPTDSDKQMLASQTGLSRNQVSNWFINARVRLWKPMVEEIHMLETKGGSTSCSTSSVVVQHKPVVVSKPTTMMINAINCSEPSGSHVEHVHLKSPNHHQMHENMDGSSSSFLGFLPYQRRGLELGGLGAVSLTLGLRHGSESSHQQQLQHQFQHHQGMHYNFTG